MVYVYTGGTFGWVKTSQQALASAGRFETNGRFVLKIGRFKRVFKSRKPSKKRAMMECQQKLWYTAIYSNSSCEPSARLSNPGSASSVWAGLTNVASFLIQNRQDRQDRQDPE